MLQPSAKPRGAARDGQSKTRIKVKSNIKSNIKNKSNIKINIKSKSNCGGQECPPYTSYRSTYLANI